MNLGRLPRGNKEWEQYWKEWHLLPPPDHPVTEDMVNEYSDWIDGTRRYLSFKDTLTMGQLEKLRILYEFKKDNEIYNFIEQVDLSPEQRFKDQQIFHIGKVPAKPKAKGPNKPRKTKWVRTRHHGVLQLRLRELEKDDN